MRKNKNVPKMLLNLFITISTTILKAFLLNADILHFVFPVSEKTPCISETHFLIISPEVLYIHTYATAHL